MKLHLIALLIFCSIAVSVALASADTDTSAEVAHIDTQVTDTDNNLSNIDISKILSDNTSLAEKRAIAAHAAVENATKKAILANCQLVAAKHAFEIARTAAQNAKTLLMLCHDDAKMAENALKDIKNMNAQFNDILEDPANDKIPK